MNANRLDTESPAAITPLMRLRKLELKSGPSSDVALSSCTNAGAGSRSALRIGKSVPAGQKTHPTHAATEKQ